MSKKRKKKINDQDKNKQSKSKTMTIDGFSNAFARLGAGTPNQLESTEYTRSGLTQNFGLLDILYRENWIIQRLIKTIPQDMLKNWYKINTQMSPDTLKKITRIERTTGIRAKILDALQWGRLYGGSAVVMMIDGHEDILDEPLDFDYIMPDSFKGLMVFDRWNGIIPASANLVDDVSDPDFDSPEYYTTTDNALGVGVRIHHSRVIRFIGTKLPPMEEMMEQYWGASIVEHIYQELVKYDNTSHNVAMLVFRACLRIYAMDNIDELGLMDEDAAKELYDTLTNMNWMMNNQGMQVISTKDRFETQQATFSGLDKVLETFMLDLSGAAGIPVTKLFGRSPAGMNATGDSDLQNYYDTIEEMQESELRPVFDRLLPVMFMSAFGGIPDDLDYDFVSPRRPTEEEKKNILSQTANAITGLFNAGIIDKHISLSELRNSSELTGMWKSITEEDIANAENESSSDGENDIPPEILETLLKMNNQESREPPNEEVITNAMEIT